MANEPTAIKAVAFAASVFVAACSSLAMPEPAQSASAHSPACDDTLDALHYVCPDGRGFSVRSSPDASCAVMFAGEGTYVVQHAETPEGRLDTDGTVSLRRNGDGTRATLSGVPDGDYADCDMLVE